MTDWPLRVTIIAPAAMHAEANALAACLGFGPADLLTFGEARWQDAAGNLYTVASTQARTTFPQAAESLVKRPEWDIEPYVVNLTGARRAQAALVVYDPAAPVAADPSRILAIIHPHAREALAMAGVSPVEQEAGP